MALFLRDMLVNHTAKPSKVMKTRFNAVEEFVRTFEINEAGSRCPMM
jgi:hypothetical protein